MTTRTRRTRALLLTALLTLTAHAACADNDDTASDRVPDSARADPTPAAGAEFNDADVTFARTMIPHHEQAIEMAELAADRASSPEVRELAEEIEAA